ncbi:PaaI family thioesterase [Vampirovibrio sp.]|uniref:PaaI family thioesterase n=1 Tax=Vampirovibrio sp. TaxID=2717857 RepID=UPI0035933965
MLEGDLEQRILDRVRKIPAFDKFGLQVLELSPGLCEAKMPRDKDFDGIFESFHGGLLMAVADTIACFAIMTHTGPDERMATTDMSIRFLAPCMTDVRAVARVIKLGRSLCPVHVDLYDLNNRLVAVAEVCYMRVS